MIYWFENDEVLVKFDKIPNLTMQFIMPWMTSLQIKEINQKPFICKEELRVVLEDKIRQETYEFSIPKGYSWDGATIPRVFWRLIGAKTDNKFLIPSLIHDVLCENHDYVGNDRYFSTVVFEGLLRVSKVPAINRWIIKHSVDNFQKLFGGW